MKKIMISLIILSSACLFAQDRQNSPNITYPQELYYHNGGRVIDITKAPFNAVGDGVTDDSDAIIAAYNFIADVHRSYQAWQDIDESYIIYFPEGDYLVSKTLIYDAPRIDYPKGLSGIFNIRLVGQNRNTTVIRLQDNCDEFNGRVKKYLVCTQQPGHGTNIPGRNEIRNLTINTGAGNTAVAAVYFLSANTGVMSDVSIISADGSGKYGLEFPGLSIQGYFSDITIDGFDFGIYVNSTIENNPTLEYITLRNQNKVGIQSYDGCPSLRKIHSTNSVPALKLAGGGTQTVIVDSELDGVSADEPAIQIYSESAQLFARNVSTTGYSGSIREYSKNVIEGPISEYFSHFNILPNGHIEQPSLNYPVEEAHSYNWPEDQTEWVLVDTCQGTSALQKLNNAMKTGKAVVWLGMKHTYPFFGSVSVPAHVTHIMGVYSNIDFQFQFLVSDASSEPLYFYNVFDRIKIIQTAARTIVYKHGSGTYENRQSSPVTIFLESIANMGFGEAFCPPHTTIYGRNLNDEIKTTSNFKIFGGVLWVLGHKTEGPTASFEVKKGGTLEVLGGYRNETGEDKGIAAVINDNSNVTYIGHTGMCSWYEYAIKEIWKSSTDLISNATLPIRSSQCATHKDRHVAIYNRYDPAVSVGRAEFDHCFSLQQNYPNPFNPQTTIEFELPHSSDVVLDIFDMQGRKTTTLLNGTKNAGFHAVVWNGKNENGVTVANGLYVYRLVAGDFRAVRKMTVLR